MAGPDTEDIDDERLDELNTLQSIYPELAVDSSNPAVPTARIELAVAPTDPLPIVFKPEPTIYKLSHLPPLLLEVILHENYPTERAPTFRLTSSPQWLSEAVLRRHEDEGTALWAEYGGVPMLFAYINFLEERARTAFRDDSSSGGPLELPQTMKAVVLALNEQLEREVFNKETFMCGVCLDPKKGSQCHRLRKCGHVFCVACLQDYYNSCIEEGNMHQVTCIDPTCGKTGDPQLDRTIKPRLISPKELLQIPLTLDMVTRYVRIMRKKKIEADPEIRFCPRTWCQGAMRTKKYPKPGDISQMDDADINNDEEEKNDDSDTPPPALTKQEEIDKMYAAGAPGADRVVVCEDCEFAFCRVCLRAWHGDIVRCVHRDSGDITKEEQMTMDLINKTTSPCPSCSVPVQKDYGCNHMTCAHCGTHFCYICGSWLTPRDPYRHFNEPKNKQCFQKLFPVDGVEDIGDRARAAQLAEHYEQEAIRIQLQFNEQDAAALDEAGT